MLGRNIGYSLSPAVHKSAFKALGIEAGYEVFDVTEDALDKFFGRLKKGEIAGCNVTIPYKEKALSYVDDASRATKVMGALNTIANENGKLKGHNTDYQGFMKALSGFGEGDLNFRAEGRSAFVFGAGGAAKAVIYGLVILGIRKVVLADIDTGKAELLAAAFSKREKNVLFTVANEQEQYKDFISRCELLVNATPCGMKNEDEGLFDYKYIHEKLYVMDLVYARETPLLKAARSAGARATGGLNMLLYQAAKSFEHWTGREAPLKEMKKALVSNAPGSGLTRAG